MEIDDSREISRIKSPQRSKYLKMQKNSFKPKFSKKNLNFRKKCKFSKKNSKILKKNLNFGKENLNFGKKILNFRITYKINIL